MRKLLAAILTFAMVFSMMSGPSVVNAAPVEVSHTVEAGDTIDVTVTGEESVWAEFTPTVDGFYWFSSQGEGDPMIDVYTENMSYINGQDDAAGLHFELLLYLRAGQTYYLALSDYGSRHENVTSEWKFSVSEVAGSDYQIEAGDTLDIADTSADSLWVEFAPTETGFYTLSTVVDVNDAPQFIIYDERMEEIAWLDGSEGEDISHTFLALAGSKYFISLGGESLGWDISMSEVYHPEHTLEAGEQETITIQTDEVKYIKFVPDATGICEISVGTSAYTDGVLIDSEGKELRYFSQNCETIVEAGEVYYLGIIVYGQEAEYDVTFTVSEVTGVEKEMEAGDTLSMALGEGEKDFVKFTPTSSGLYTLYSMGEGDPFCEIFCGGASIGFADDDHNEYQFATINEYVAGETYYFALGNYEEGNYTVTLLPGAVYCDGQVSAAPYCISKQFSDLTVPSWYHDSVDWVLECGIMNGTGGDKFSPTGTTTRAMVVTMLQRFAGENANDVMKDACDFNDVDMNTWYSDAVAWASYNGIVNGVGDGSFAPNRNITRQEFVVMLYNFSLYWNGPSMNQGNSVDLSGFLDGNQVASWAQDAVDWAADEWILTGVPTTGGVNINPTGLASRVEAATLLYRFW